VALAGVVVTVADLHPIAVHAASLGHRRKSFEKQGATWTSGRPEISLFGLNMAPNRENP